MPESPEPEDLLQSQAKHRHEYTREKMQVLAIESYKRTCIAGLAIDTFFWGAANCPVPIHKEAVTEWMTQPLHSWRHTTTRR